MARVNPRLSGDANESPLLKADFGRRLAFALVGSDSLP
jgi:hypothetical protein